MRKARSCEIGDCPSARALTWREAQLMNDLTLLVSIAEKLLATSHKRRIV